MLQETLEIKKKLETMPIVSSRRLATQLPASHSTMYHVMQKIAYPYKIRVLQELKPLDFGKCANFCCQLSHYVRCRLDVLDTMFFLDEAWFHLSNYVNQQNFRVRSATNPHEYTECTLHPAKVRVRCAIPRK